MRERDFAHLHLHTDYSLLDGAIQIKPLARRAEELGMRAVAITDHGSLSGAITFYEQMRARGIKPIIGMEAYIARGRRTDRGQAGNGDEAGQRGTNHIILLAKDLRGYRNLVRLSSRAYTEGFYYKPRIDRELLAAHAEGLIALSACLSGVPSALLLAGRFDEASRAACEFQEMMGRGNYYLEVQNHGLKEETETVIPGMMELSRKTGIQLVATNDCHYLRREDWRAHDLLIRLGAGKTISDSHGLRYKEGEFYVRSAEEMWQLFGDDLPEALLNTVAIAEMCELELPAGDRHLPVYRVPEGETAESYFAGLARAGLAERWRRIKDAPGRAHAFEDYSARLEHEIDVITRMGFAGYFLVVWDFIRYAKTNDIPVGPGRGSASGSMASYALGITDLDPLRYGLVFERFLNPERVSMPDIDIDFCVRGRQQVIDYVADYYGRDHVSQISTFGTMASRAVIKDVGRVLEMPFAEVDRITKMVPPPVRGRNCPIEEALRQSHELRAAYEQSDRVRQVIDAARRLEGCARHPSVHAAGVVISPRPIEELVPLARTNKDEVVTQYTMTDLETVGMLKMDFLGLTTLTIISDCLKSIEAETGRRPDLAELPLDDEATLRLFREARTEAVFQFEGEGMKDLCRRLRPEGIEDISALNALYRPGPIDSGMIDDFIARRRGDQKVEYEFEELRDVMAPTLGVIVYQEQILAVFQRLAGYSLGEADLVRRAMGKKKREELDKHKEKFITQATERGHERAKIERLWHSMEGFADYAFPRAHSFSYGLLAYQTAYLKAHHPTHFWGAVMSNELGDTAKVVKYINAARSASIDILPPDVNASLDRFTARGGAIRFGLAAIKGIGEAAVHVIIAARQSGEFTSIFDFTERVDPKAAGRRALESLIKSGAFDSLGETRAALFASIDKAVESGQRARNARATGQRDLFGGVADQEAPKVSPAPEWAETERLRGEKDTVGFYISGHPVDGYSDTLDCFASAGAGHLATLATGRKAVVGGIVSDMNVKSTKRGDKFGIFFLEDRSGSVKVVAWPETYAKANGCMSNDQAALVKGTLEIEEGGQVTVIAEEIVPLRDAWQMPVRAVVVRAAAEDVREDRVARLYDLFASNRGESRLLFDVAMGDGVIARVKPDRGFKVKFSPELVARVKEVCGNFRVLAA